MRQQVRQGKHVTPRGRNGADGDPYWEVLELSAVIKPVIGGLMLWLDDGRTLGTWLLRRGTRVFGRKIQRAGLWIRWDVSSGATLAKCFAWHVQFWTRSTLLQYYSMQQLQPRDEQIECSSKLGQREDQADSIMKRKAIANALVQVGTRCLKP